VAWRVLIAQFSQVELTTVPTFSWTAVTELILDAAGS
jgi:hypothetical protein